MTQKAEIRKSFLALRDSLSQARRLEAANLAYHELKKLSHPLILSFFSFGSEIDLYPFNCLLAEQGRLVLPKRNGLELELYRVRDLFNDLDIISLGLREPRSTVCEKIEPDSVDLALIPAIAFDQDLFRLGFGKGHYDRFLGKNTLKTMGVGFREQLIERPLPRDPWDIRMDSLCLL
ncbi:MAG TPA: 5-formyltetrahydrofolate cyclo-ligase [Chlamydiales bacterium]|nr:5-formyltetrahydrofolate cyclo-ligase [Chlamydiales bacterium]